MDAVFIGLPDRRIAIPARPPRPLRTFQPYLRKALRLRRSGLLPATANVIAVCRIGFRRRLRLKQFARTELFRNIETRDRVSRTIVGPVMPRTGRSETGEIALVAVTVTRCRVPVPQIAENVGHAVLLPIPFRGSVHIAVLIVRKIVPRIAVRHLIPHGARIVAGFRGIPQIGAGLGQPVVNSGRTLVRKERKRMRRGVFQCRNGRPALLLPRMRIGEGRIDDRIFRRLRKSSRRGFGGRTPAERVLAAPLNRVRKPRPIRASCRRLPANGPTIRGRWHRSPSEVPA